VQFAENGRPYRISCKLTLDPFISLDNRKYELCCVVEHWGSQNENGHFVVYFRVGDQWYFANDAHVRPCDRPGESSGAALVLYCDCEARAMQHTRSLSLAKRLTDVEALAVQTVGHAQPTLQGVRDEICVAMANNNTSDLEVLRKLVVLSSVLRIEVVDLLCQTFRISVLDNQPIDAQWRAATLESVLSAIDAVLHMEARLGGLRELSQRVADDAADGIVDLDAHLSALPGLVDALLDGWAALDTNDDTTAAAGQLAQATHALVDTVTLIYGYLRLQTRVAVLLKRACANRRSFVETGVNAVAQLRQLLQEQEQFGSEQWRGDVGSLSATVEGMLTEYRAQRFPDATIAGRAFQQLLAVAVGDAASAVCRAASRRDDCSDRGGQGRRCRRQFSAAPDARAGSEEGDRGARPAAAPRSAAADFGVSGDKPIDSGANVAADRVPVCRDEQRAQGQGAAAAQAAG
jgi:hypothetical protein